MGVWDEKVSVVVAVAVAVAARDLGGRDAGRL